MKKKLSLLIRLIFLILPLVFVWLLGLVVFNRVINSYEIDTKTKTDAIVVLTGGRNRLPEAVKLFNAGKAEKLFISGVRKDVSLDELSARQAIEIRTDEGVFMENISTNTVENAINTSRWIRENDIKSIRLVTSNYHIPRSLAEFKGKNKKLKIIPNPIYSENVSKSIFSSWGTFSLIAVEYTKFLCVWVRENIQENLRSSK